MFKKLSKKELGEAMVQATQEYTQHYFEVFKKPLDKQLWAALHLGFTAAMKLHGYTDDETSDAIDECQSIMVKMESDFAKNQNGKQ